MKKLLISALGGVAALAMAAPASAALVVTVSPPAGTFGNNDVSGAGTTPGGTVMGAFSDSVSFAGVAGFNLATLTISSGETTNPDTRLDFSSVTFNGTPFAILATGATEFRSLLNSPLLSTNTLTVAGTAGNSASYSGTITLASAPSVPEPATWAMMLVGFGAVGYGMRRRRASTTVRFQAA